MPVQVHGLVLEFQSWSLLSVSEKVLNCRRGSESGLEEAWRREK